MNEFSKTLAVGLGITGIFMTGWFLGADYTKRNIAEIMMKDMQTNIISYVNEFVDIFVEAFEQPKHPANMPDEELVEYMDNLSKEFWKDVTDEERSEAILNEKFKTMQEGIVKGEIE